MNKGFLNLIAFFLACLFVGCDRSEKIHVNHDKTYGGVYHRIMIDDPFTLDPAEFNDRNSIMIANQIFDRLLEMDEDFNLLPSLAKKWEISGDHKTYTFTIRDDIFFHNGDPLSVEDVVFSIQRLQQGGAFNGALVSKYLAAAKVYKAGDHQVILELENPFPPILLILASANASIISKHVYDAKGADYFRTPVGTGPFYLKTWKVGNEIILGCNERYFLGRPYLDGVTYRKLKENEAQELFYRQELEDIAPFRLIDKDPRNQNLLQVKKSVFQTNIIYFNTKKEPFDDLRVRQAFIYAFNKNDFYSRVSDVERTQAKGFIPRGITGYDMHFVEDGYDLAKAKKLLAAAGYPNGLGLPKITILRPNTYPYLKEFTEAVVSYYQKIGVFVDVKPVEFQEIIKSFLNNTTQMANCEINLDLPEAFFSLTYFHSRYPFDFTNVNDKTVNELLEKVLFMETREERMATYRKIDKIITNDYALLINLFYDDFFDGYFQNYVRGVSYSKLGVVYMRMNRIWLEKI